MASMCQTLSKNQGYCREHTHTQFRNNLYYVRIVTITSDHKLCAFFFLTNIFIISQFLWSGLRVTHLVFQLESYKAKIKIPARAYSFLETLRENLLPSSFTLLTEFRSRWLQTSLTLLADGSQLLGTDGISWFMLPHQSQ